MNPYKRMKNSTNFMDLNDDCLLYLLNFMKLEELLMLRGVCIRFDNLLYQYRKRFDYFSIRDLPGAYEALQFLGPVIKTIYLYPRTFQNAVPEIFDWITEFCVNLESLDLAGVDVIPKQKFITLVRRVTSLTMRGVYFDDSLGDCFKGTSIEELKLVALRDLTEQFFIHISNLRALTICCCRTMPCDSYIQVLKKNLNLKKLEIKVSDGWYSPNEIKDSDKLVEYIANNLHEIEELTFDSSVSNRSLFGNLPNLKKLEIELNELDEFDELDSWSWNQISHDINKLIENLSKSNTIEILFINGYEHHIDMVNWS
ncbi:uncharacterized protein LOC134834900 [Culicoides brevitarsis]|uniref:uncharacterized protein LOC134834900 n=1 Tax=Culicoides brevitarsis TaxID=469753 RepID=UPI00307BA03F